MAKVSVVIPVYNVEKYLRECLDSVQKQTLEELEIICIDDGSTDCSGAILDEYAQKDSRFHVIHKKNEGYGKAINTGMDLVTSPYVGIVESDDWIDPAMYQNLYEVMGETKADVIKADFYEFYTGAEGNYIEEYKFVAEGDRASLYHMPFAIEEHPNAFYLWKYTWSGIYRTDFLRKEQIYHNETPGASYQDNGFWFQMMVKAKKIYLVNQAFYHYRIDNAASSIHSKGKVFAVCDEFDFIRKKVEEMGEEGEPYHKWILYFRITDCIGNLDRVGEEYRLMLAQRIKKEFLEGLQAGEVDAHLYRGLWKQKIFELLASPEQYVERLSEERRRLQERAGGYPMIILYGAGRIGQQALSYFIDGRLRTKIKYFAVSDPSQNKKEIKGIPIVDIRSLQSYREEALVVLAVGENLLPELKNTIEGLQFQHVLSFQEIVKKEAEAFL